MNGESSPTVSVVIPSYRRAGTIRTAIDSALAQTWTDLEIVVVDDASGDDTQRVVQEIDDPRVRLLVHQRNRGGNAARRTAIEASRGRYIAFLDADDSWYPTKLERQLASLERAGSGTGFSYTWYEVQRPDGTVHPGRRPLETGLATPTLLGSNFVGTFSTVLVERTALEQVGGPDPSLPACQDWEFYLRVNEVTGIDVVPEILARYWRGDDDPDRISSSAARVAAGHREVYRRQRARICALPRAQADLSRRYFLEILANHGDAAAVLHIVGDMGTGLLRPDTARFCAHMVARAARKRYLPGSYRSRTTAPSGEAPTAQQADQGADTRAA